MLWVSLSKQRDKFAMNEGIMKVEIKKLIITENPYEGFYIWTAQAKLLSDA